MRVWFAVILVLAGVILCLYPEYKQAKEDFRERQLLAALGDLSESAAGIKSPEQEEPPVSTEIAPVITQAAHTPSATGPAMTSVSEAEAADAIGIIEIPKIEVRLPILNDVDDESLDAGVGHFPETALPGEQGNTAIAGHRSYKFGRKFNRLNELEINDSITIIRNKRRFDYLVTEIKVVEPDEISVLDQPEKGRFLTLITCEPIRVASHRLIIRAVQTGTSELD